MPAVTDIIPGTYLREEFGAIVAATRVSLVYAAGNLVGDILANALNTYPFVPAPGEALSTATPFVRCVARVPKIVGRRSDGLWKVIVTSDYEYLRPLEKHGKSIEGGGALIGTETQVNRSGIPIKVGYPPNLMDPTRRLYGVTLNVMDPSHSVIIDVLEETNAPDDIVAEWLRYCNSTPWRSGEAYQWLCTTCRYRLVDEQSDPAQYLFHYEFLKKIGADGKGWIHTGAYRNSDGTIPSDATYDPDGLTGDTNGGLIDIKFYPERDYQEKFPG